MFTIRHYSPEGYETLVEATEVNFKPEAPDVGNMIWYTAPGTREIKSIERGMVYIMNETGATVSKYELSPPADRPTFSVGRVKEMAERFLRWKLPANFNPDGGISFTATYNNGTPQGGRHEPTGTNLFGYTEAVDMVRYMLDLDALRD